MTKLEAVQWLTISEIAKLWEPQLKIAASTIERELRHGLYKIEKTNAGELDGDYDELRKPLAKPPPEDELPSKDSLINRAFIESFCDKQLWMLPSFWFKDLPTGPSFPGRPSIMQSVIVELKSRAEQNGVEHTLAEQCRVLEAWAKETFPGQQTPKAKSIENGVRPTYNFLKKDYPPRDP